jgi:hypothetical protein
MSLAPALSKGFWGRLLTTSLTACEINLFEALREFLVSCASWFFLAHPRSPLEGQEMQDRQPTTTPWGQVQEVRTIAPGISVLSTASHAGIYLSPEFNDQVPDQVKEQTFNCLGFQGFYEEDEDAQLIQGLFPQLTF